MIGEGNLIIEDIIEAAEEVNSHGLSQIEWIRNHIFTGNPPGQLGYGAQNRGRTPFLRIFYSETGGDTLSQGPQGGTLSHSVTIDIVLCAKAIQNNKNHFQVAQNIWEELKESLRNRFNFLHTEQTRATQLETKFGFYILRCEIDLRTSFGG